MYREPSHLTPCIVPNFSTSDMAKCNSKHETGQITNLETMGEAISKIQQFH